mgnify:CR=1 FL=1
MKVEEFREIMLEYSKTKDFENRVKQAEQIIEKGLSFRGKKYVAFSGGKDSTAMLHLVLKFEPDIMVYHSDNGKYIPREFEQEVIENARLIGANNLRIEVAGDFFERKVWEYYREGFRVCFVGLRKEEAVHRRLRIQADESLTVIKEFWPLQDWSWRDVWAYVFANALPIHSAYLKYAPVVGWDKVRFHTFFDPKFERFGSPNLDGVLLWKHKSG